VVEAFAVESFGGRGAANDVGLGEMGDHRLPGGCGGVVRLVDKHQPEIVGLVGAQPSRHGVDRGDLHRRDTTGTAAGDDAVLDFHLD
jgi:hypothetical protein